MTFWLGLKTWEQGDKMQFWEERSKEAEVLTAWEQ